MRRPYKSALGFNNTIGLALVTPQPASPLRVRYQEQGFNSDRSSYEDGPLYTEWEWDNLTNDGYYSALNPMGLYLATYAELTIVTVNEVGLPQRYNSKATRLYAEYRGGYWRNVKVVHYLEPLT